MDKLPRVLVPVFLGFTVLISSCNLPVTSPTESSSPSPTDTPRESESETDSSATTAAPISADALGEVFDLAFDSQGTLWVGTSDGVVQCDASLESCQFFSMAVGSAVDEVRAVAPGPDGSLWFGTTAGLVHYDAGAWETITSSDGLVDDIIFDLEFDADGGLWIGTSSGVSHFANSVWANYTTTDGLADDYVHCVFATGEQEIWFGTSMGVSRFDGVNWTTYDQASGLPASDILSITEDTQGVIWLGTLFGGAVRYDAYDWQSYTFSGDMDENVVQAIALGSDDILWLGTRAGAIRYDGIDWLGYSATEGLPSNDVRAIAIAADGAVFFGTNEGITRFEYSREKMQVIQEPVSPQSGSALPEGDPIPHLAPGEEITISAIHMSDADRGWAIGGLGEYGDHVLRTSDGGLTWLDVTPPEPAPGPEDEEKMAAGFFIDETTGWVVYHSVPRESELGSTVLGIWYTFDAGSSWHWSGPFTVDFVGSAFNPPHLDFSTPQTGWIMARLGGVGMHKYPVYLFVTKDGGAHWTRLVDPYESIYLQSCQKTGMSFAFEQTGWVTIASCPIEGAEVVVTGDGGATWEAVALPAPEEQPDLFGSAGCETHFPTLFSSTHGALAMSCLRWENDERVEDHYVYITEDAGETWQTHRYPGGTLLFIDADIAYALSTDIYRTQDGGETWTKVKSVSWEGQFSFVSQQLGWAVARSDTEIALVKTENGGQSWSIIEPVISSE
jgi:photosystem II stability/assembly factor-like uncharacterized protein